MAVGLPDLPHIYPDTFPTTYPTRPSPPQGGFARVYSYTQLPFHPPITTTSSSSSSSHPSHPNGDGKNLSSLSLSKEQQDALNAHVARGGTRQAVKVVPHDKLASCKKRTKVRLSFLSCFPG